MSQKSNDPVAFFRAVKQGLNSKGGKRIQLYLDTEQATALLTAITKANGATGVKLDLHIGQRQNKETGATFDSAMTFIKPVQERPSSGAATYVPKVVDGGATQN